MSGLDVEDLEIPGLLDSEEVADGDIVELVRTFGAATVLIVNAIMFGQRVLFISRTQPAKHLCGLVLAAVQSCQPIRPGILHVCFPAAALSDASFTAVPGYVAAVTNPVFESNRK